MSTQACCCAASRPILLQTAPLPTHVRCSPRHGEPFNVLRYELDQHYDSHYDSFGGQLILQRFCRLCHAACDVRGCRFWWPFSGCCMQRAVC